MRENQRYIFHLSVTAGYHKWPEYHIMCCFIHSFLDARNFALKFNLVPVNKTVILGKKVMFECLASRTRNVEYFWKHNNEVIKINHRYSLVNGLRITGTVLKDNGKYTCVARDKISGKEVSTSSYLLVQGKII
jgi:hypothetical protein